MLVALSPSVFRLRMSSLDHHGDAASSKLIHESAVVAEGDLPLVVMPEDTTSPPVRYRPKLSLQTSSLPSPYTKSSKGALGSSVVLPNSTTPTTSNTIANSTQIIPLRPSPATPRSSFSRPPQSRPYTQPIGLHSILKSGPETPKLGIKRSHSLFSADSSSPHSTRRIFFPPVKKVKFEADERLAIAIPIQNSYLSSRPTSADDQSNDPKEASISSAEEEIPLSVESTVAADEHEPEAPSPTVAALPLQRFGAPRTRNGTPPPATSPSRKKRKIRKWEWTIDTSPASAKREIDGS